MDMNGEQAKSLDTASSNEEFYAHLDQLSSGRLTLWGKCVQVLQNHPYGTGMPTGMYLGTHVHNDFLSRYFTEGLIGLALLILMYAWMAGLSDGPYSTDMGLCFAVIFFTVGLANCVFAHVPMLLVP